MRLHPIEAVLLLLLLSLFGIASLVGAIVRWISELFRKD